MAKPARGLPIDFSLDLPDDGPVMIGDFLDEPPPAVTRPTPRVAPPEPRREVVFEREEGTQAFVRNAPPPPARQKPAPPKIIRYQLNLTPGTKRMLEEISDYVQTYSPEPNTRPSEIFQGIIGLLHAAMDDLDLASLPRRGAWGSVTARNFPGALSEAFEKAIVQNARRERGG